jgi:hypothetical protein
VLVVVCHQFGVSLLNDLVSPGPWIGVVARWGRVGKVWLGRCRGGGRQRGSGAQRLWDDLFRRRLGDSRRGGGNFGGQGAGEVKSVAVGTSEEETPPPPSASSSGFFLDFREKRALISESTGILF